MRSFLASDISLVRLCDLQNLKLKILQSTVTIVDKVEIAAKI